MFNSEAIDVVIGLAFVFLLLSLLASAINESIATLFSLRGRNLRKAIAKMFEEAGGKFNIKTFYEDAHVRPLSARPVLNKLGLKTPPSYLPVDLFSDLAVRAIFKVKEGETATVKALDQKIDEMFPQKGKVNETLKRMVTASAGNVSDLRARMAKWYDVNMDHATEWYRSKVQVVLFCIGLVIAVVFNADAIGIARDLSNNPEARAKIVAQAADYVEATKELPAFKADTTVAKLEALMNDAHGLVKDQINDTSHILGMGWSGVTGTSWIRKFGNGVAEGILGWILTALAISLGASFWFDTLGRVMKLRHAGTVKEKKETKPEPVG